MSSELEQGLTETEDLIDELVTFADTVTGSLDELVETLTTIPADLGPAIETAAQLPGARQRMVIAVESMCAALDRQLAAFDRHRAAMAHVTESLREKLREGTS